MTNYEALRKKAEEIIEEAKAKLCSRIEGTNEAMHRDVMRLFTYDAEGLRAHLVHLESFHYPLGDNFEKDETFNPKSDTYRVITEGVERHLSGIRRWQTGENCSSLLALALLTKGQTEN